MTKVSVIIPAYNAERFLQKSLESVLNQTETDIEAIVVNDGSSDSTRAIAEEIARHDRRVRVVDIDDNRGVGHARNVAIGGARGDWIAILDADDWYDPVRLETLTQLGESHGAVVVADNLNSYVDGAARPWRTLLADPSAPPRWIDIEAFLERNIFGQASGLVSLKPMVRRSFLIENSIAYKEDMRTDEDFDFLVNCLGHCRRMLISHRPMYNYRYRFDSAVRTSTVDDLYVTHKNTLELAARYSRSNDKAVAARLDQRAESIQNFIRYVKVVKSLKQGRLGSATNQMIHSFEILPFMVVCVGHAVVSKLRRRIRQ